LFLRAALGAKISHSTDDIANFFPSQTNGKPALQRAGEFLELQKKIFFRQKCKNNTKEILTIRLPLKNLLLV